MSSPPRVHSLRWDSPPGAVFFVGTVTRTPRHAVPCCQSVGTGSEKASLGDAAVGWTEQRQVCTPGRLGSSRNFVPRLVQPAVPQVCVREDRHGRESNVTYVTMVTPQGTGVSQRDHNPRGPRRGVCRPSRRHAGHSIVRSVALPRKSSGSPCSSPAPRAPAITLLPPRSCFCLSQNVMELKSHSVRPLRIGFSH